MIAGEHPIILPAPMVRAVLDGRKTQIRNVVTRHNSTVLGECWGRKSPWDGLRFAEAVARERNPLTGTRSPHLAVPFCHPEDEPTPSEDCGVYRVRPRWETGARLWVRETHQRFDKGTCDQHVWYTAGRNDMSWSEFAPHRGEVDPDEPWPAGRLLQAGDGSGAYTVPPIHMPRWASRIDLDITEVRGERLQDISEEDAFAEGAPQYSSALKLSRDRPFMPEHKGCYREGFSELWESVYGPGAWDANPWVWAVSFRRVGSPEPSPTTSGRRASPESHTEEVA